MVVNPWASALKVALGPLWGVGSIPTAIRVYFHSLAVVNEQLFLNEGKHLFADVAVSCFGNWSSLPPTYLTSAEWE